MAHFQLFSFLVPVCGSMGCYRKNSFFNHFMFWTCVSHVFLTMALQPLPAHVNMVKEQTVSVQTCGLNDSVVNLSSFQNTMASGSTSCTRSCHKNIVLLTNGSTAALTRFSYCHAEGNISMCVFVCVLIYHFLYIFVLLLY